MDAVWLYVYGSGQPFAFSNDGEQSWFTSDGRPWAWRSDDGWLWSYTTRQAIGWFSGSTLFDTLGKPLCFKGA